LVYTWAISDVISNNIKIIGSGPTIPCPEIDPNVEVWLEDKLVELGISTTLPHLYGRIERICKDQGFEEQRYISEVLLTRQDLLEVLCNEFTEIGYTPKILEHSLELSVEESVEYISSAIKRHANQPNTILIWAGEPTISLSKVAIRDGKGGRISALCCLLSESLAEHKNVLFLGLATDAQDGSSPVAAYFIDHTTSHHLRPLGGARKIISQGNSGYALKIMNYGITLSHTNLNLADLYLAIIK
jgi:glycerate-2-kinase